MCTPEEPTSCNRRPFMSEDGCDRGNVDIHQFDELPYCGGISPTNPEIPPEIVDTPISLPVPPPCSCFKIEFGFPVFRYTPERTFATSSSFKSVGDCCEGNYKSDFNIEIPCPVLGTEDNTIKIGIGYGDGDGTKEAKYVERDGDECSITTNDVDMDLQIPCPAKESGDRFIKTKGRWAKSFSEKSTKFVSVDRSNCEVEFMDGEIELDVACPIGGREVSKVSAEIKYGEGNNRDEAVFMRSDNEGCKIEGVDAELSLWMPCPFKDQQDSKISVAIGYGTSFKGGSGKVLSADEEKCEITPNDALINLEIPCPLDNVRINGEDGIVVSETVGNCAKTFTIGLGDIDIGGGGGGGGCNGFSGKRKVVREVYWSYTKHLLYAKFDVYYYECGSVVRVEKQNSDDVIFRAIAHTSTC